MSIVNTTADKASLERLPHPIVSETVQEHLQILHGQQASNAFASRLPAINCTGLDVLDIGCGIGQHLLAPQFKSARSLHGIDIDPAAVRYALDTFPQLIVQCAPAEAIPYPDASFDLTYSSVSVCYTRIPIALAEMFRVTRPGGTVWLSLHGIRMEWYFTRGALCRLKVKALLNRLYVQINGLYFALTGDTFYRPGSDKMESFQFKGAMRRAMKRAGFVDIRFGEDGYKLLVQAQRP